MRPHGAGEVNQKSNLNDAAGLIKDVLDQLPALLLGRICRAGRRGGAGCGAAGQGVAAWPGSVGQEGGEGRGGSASQGGVLSAPMGWGRATAGERGGASRGAMRRG